MSFVCSGPMPHPLKTLEHFSYIPDEAFDTPAEAMAMRVACMREFNFPIALHNLEEKVKLRVSKFYFAEWKDALCGE